MKSITNLSNKTNKTKLLKKNDGFLQDNLNKFYLSD